MRLLLAIIACLAVWLAFAAPAGAQLFRPSLRAEDCSVANAGDGNYTLVNCGISEEAVQALIEDARGRLRAEEEITRRLLEEDYGRRIAALESDSVRLRSENALLKENLTANPLFVQAAYVEGERLFGERDYQAASGLIRGAYDQATDRVSREYLGNMATASYFGAGRHREGLKFICERYRSLPSSDRRYRHDVHSHVRAIARQEGYQEALAVLTLLRDEFGCIRPDFSPIWAAIPLEIGWAIAKGWTRKQIFKGTPKLERDDIALLQTLIASNVPFSDHGLFVLSRLDEIVDGHPHSVLREVSQVGLIEFAEDPVQAKQLAEAFVAEHPDSRYVDVVYDALYQVQLQARAFDAARESLAARDGPRLQAFLESLDINQQPPTILDTWHTIYADYESNALSALNFGDLARVADMTHVHYRQWSEFAATELEIDFDRLRRCEAVLKAEVAANAFGDELDEALAGDYESACTSGPAIPLDEFGSWYANLAPQVISPELARRISAYFDTAATGMAERGGDDLFQFVLAQRDCLMLRTRDAVDDACTDIMIGTSRSMRRALMTALLEACERRCGEDNGDKVAYVFGTYLRWRGLYDEHRQKMEQLVNEYPDSDLVDDAMAEVGWYHFVIKKDTANAERVWTAIVAEMPNSNAYDNALNWLAIMYRQTGRFDRAIGASLLLTVDIVSERLRRIGRERALELRVLSDDTKAAVRSANLLLCNDWPNSFFGSSAEESTVVVCGIDEDSRLWNRGVRMGMQLGQLNGEWLSTVYDFARYIDANGIDGAALFLGWSGGFEGVDIEAPIAELLE